VATSDFKDSGQRLAPRPSRFTIRDLADGALLVEYPDLPDEEANAAAVAGAEALERKMPSGFLDAVPGARTLLIEFDPFETSSERLSAILSSRGPARGAGLLRTLRVPVVYGGPAGVDLSGLAQAAGVSTEEFARLHATACYRVAFLGFAPGFAYLTGLPPLLHAPRLETPRTRVPAGALAIGGPYTGIYPVETPGGWRLIGRTPVRLFDPDADPPTLFSPGDRVFFEPIREEDFNPALASAPRLSAPGREPPMGSPLFRVLSPGVFTSLQGSPRYGSSRYGVPPGGAMDSVALARGNARLSNLPEAAGVEMTWVGAEVEALAETTVCLQGAAPDTQWNGRSAPIGEPFRLRSGDRLRVARISRGARSYLCVEGGLATDRRPRISPRLAPGDILRSAIGSAHPGFPVPRLSFPHRSDLETGEIVVRVVLGAHRSLFREEGLATFRSSVFRVSSSSDRRGIRLQGPPVALAGSPDIPPEGIPLGAIQIARDGMPMVLGPDRPVTGGYVRIATVIGADFPLLAQAVPGDAVRFVDVDLAEALRARVG